MEPICKETGVARGRDAPLLPSGRAMSLPHQCSSAMLISTVANSGLKHRPKSVFGIKDQKTGELYRFPPVETGRVEIREETFRY